MRSSDLSVDLLSGRRSTGTIVTGQLLDDHS